MYEFKTVLHTTLRNLTDVRNVFSQSFQLCINFVYYMRNGYRFKTNCEFYHMRENCACFCVASLSRLMTLCKSQFVCLSIYLPVCDIVVYWPVLVSTLKYGSFLKFCSFYSGCCT